MLSIPDMALLGAAALMFFGPEQLPKVARKVGLLMRDVQNTSQTFIREMERAADDHDSGADVARAHLLDEPPYRYDPPAHDPGVYGAYDGGYVASPVAHDVPADEALPAHPESAHAAHELELPLHEPPSGPTSAGHQSAP